MTDLSGTAADSENAVYGTNEITKLELNSKLTLSDGTGFVREHYRLIGWNDDKDAADNLVVKYELGGTYGIDDPEGNTLYAVWEPITAPLEFVKEGEQADKIATIALPDAEFGLYTMNEDGTYKPISEDETYGQYYTNGMFNPTATSDASGKVKFKGIPVEGEYYIHEITAPEGYALDETYYKVEISAPSVTDESGNAMSNYSAKLAGITQTTASGEQVIVNNLTGVDITVLKVDAMTKAPLEGVVFAINKKYSAENSEGIGERTYREGLTTNVSGEFTVNLSDGDYVLVEKSTLAGYVIMENNFEFTVQNGAITVTTDGKKYFSKTDDGKLMVENVLGVTLPSTGGTGTAPFTVAGACILGIAVFLLLRKRMEMAD